MNLMSSTFFSILVNGVPSSPFSSSRGICQGDSLSPFIFVLIAKGLGRLIKHVVQSQDLRGISVHGTSTITHQQFVDDKMLFGHPLVHKAHSFIDTFSLALGTTINTAKSKKKFFHTPLQPKESLPES